MPKKRERPKVPEKRLNISRENGIKNPKRVEISQKTSKNAKKRQKQPQKRENSQKLELPISKKKLFKTRV